MDCSLSTWLCLTGMQAGVFEARGGEVLCEGGGEVLCVRGGWRCCVKGGGVRCCVGGGGEVVCASNLPLPARREVKGVSCLGAALCGARGWRPVGDLVLSAGAYDC